MAHQDKASSCLAWGRKEVVDCIGDNLRASHRRHMTFPGYERQVCVRECCRQPSCLFNGDDGIGLAVQNERRLLDVAQAAAQVWFARGTIQSDRRRL